MTKMTINSQSTGRLAWAVGEAKARFSEMIERAVTDGPQTIMRNGKPAVVVVSAEEGQRKTHRSGNLAAFFAVSPLRRSGLKSKRSKTGPRSVEL